MYEEKKYSINWLKIFVVVIIGFLVIILSVKLITLIFKNQNYKTTSKAMEKNLKVMNDVAKSYFTEDKLPAEVGKSVKFTLDELIKDGKISEIKDKDGNECNREESFIEATKLDTEYQIKSYLSCGDESDYINSFMESASNLITIRPEVTEPRAEETTTVAKTTTTEPTTTTTQVQTTTTTTTKKVEKYYTVSFNANGGDLIDSISVKEGDIVSLPVPVRTGYTFIGWYQHGSVYNTNERVYSDKVLVAKWIKN